MIKVKVKKNDNIISSISISGHSGYASSGYDIVCSAVSSVITTTVNGILSFKDTIKTSDDGNVLLIEILEHDEITDKLIENMLNLLKEIERQYQKNIKMEGD